MEENYLNIFCRFLAELVETEKIDPQGLWHIANEFKPYCDKLNSRQDLINFLNKHLADYPELLRLKAQLEDSSYKFNF